MTFRLVLKLTFDPNLYYNKINKRINIFNDFFPACQLTQPASPKNAKAIAFLPAPVLPDK
jgi:hypothetical protein